MLVGGHCWKLGSLKKMCGSNDDDDDDDVMKENESQPAFLLK